MAIDLSGKQLHTLMIKNGKSLKVSAQTLGISIEEMQAYLDCESFEIAKFNDIVRKLDLLNIIEIPNNPNAITPAAFDLLQAKDKIIEAAQKIIETKETIIKEKQELFIEQLDKMLHLYVIIEKYLRKEFLAKGMEEHYQYIKKILIEHRGHSF